MKLLKLTHPRSPLVLLLIGLMLPGLVAAKVRLPACIGDHMVLQQGEPLPVWGWAAPGEKVTVEISGQRHATTADVQGKWSVTLSPLRAGGAALELKVTGENTLTVKDVLVGEVWLASGQSNMAFRMSGCARAGEEIAAAKYEGIRVFTVNEQFAQQPQTDVKGQWQICAPEVAGSFSAVAYFFGREIHTNLHVPVGLVVSSVGGTPIESWMARDTLVGDPACAALLESWKDVSAEEFEKIAVTYRAFQRERSEFTLAAKAAQDQGLPAPRAPKAPTLRCHDYPSALFNGMIAPLLSLRSRGVIWYQGESNTSKSEHYDQLFPAMIQQWRRDWRQNDLPFYFVQLANYLPGGQPPGGYARLRESQRKALALPHTGMAVTIDIGDAHNIHPTNKQDVGKRLALWALANTYQRRLVYSGPLYESSKVQGDTVVVRFNQVGGGLVAKTAPLKQFEVAGADGKFAPAAAVITGDTVRVRCDQVPHPVSVRYAWADNPEGCNLYNAAGLPASPFTTANLK